MLWTEAHRRPFLQFPAGAEYPALVTRLLLTCEPGEFYDWVGHVHYGTRCSPVSDEYDEDLGVASEWTAACNERFEQHKAAWRFIGGELCPVSGPEEVASLENAHEAAESSDKLEGCRTHYRSALSCFAASDYPNTGKEAISALESLAQVATGKNRTLGQLTDELESLASLHTTHGAMISKLYGPTSDGATDML
ncbi:MAG: hypothetical protein IPG04_36820 [Polyangiaceae bacterium]|nr:hypothetical protein [Polyangiaceae bacterium]